MSRLLKLLFLLLLLFVPAGGELLGNGFGPPRDVKVVYVSDSCVDLSWVKSEPYSPAPPTAVKIVVNTLVRLKWGEPPKDRDDGYFVYYGEDESFRDNSIDLTSSMVPYYRLWSETVFYGVGGIVLGNVWDEKGVVKEVNFMSLSFIFVGLAILTLGVTTASLWRRSLILSLGSAMGWTTLGVLFVTDPIVVSQFPLSTTWVRVIAFFLFSMAFGCMIWYLTGVGKTQVTKTDGKRTWSSWEKAPDEPVKSRASLVKERHRERLRALRRGGRLS